MTHPDDDWLDAFVPDDFANPDLDGVDESVARLLARVEDLPEAPRRPSRRWHWGLALAAAGVLAWVGSDLQIPNATAPQLDARAEPSPAVQSERVLPPVPPVPQVAPIPARVRPPHEANLAVEQKAEPAEPEASKPALLFGLSTAPGTALRIEGDAAVLSSGRLAYVHDARHDPGVRRARWEALPLEVRPVGTAFELVARPQVGAVRVDAGSVQLVHEGGTVMASLGPGQEVIALPDLGDGLGVLLLHTTGLPLDSVLAMVPPDCLCRPEDVVASVATLRLTGLSTPPESAP